MKIILSNGREVDTSKVAMSDYAKELLDLTVSIEKTKKSILGLPVEAEKALVERVRDYLRVINELTKISLNECNQKLLK